jgi:hypothetical protein
LGVNASLGFTTGDVRVSYNAFFLAGVLAMANFGIASNTAWSFFLDRDNGILLRDVDLPDEPVAVPAGQGAVQRRHRRAAGGDHRAAGGAVSRRCR